MEQPARDGRFTRAVPAAGLPRGSMGRGAAGRPMARAREEERRLGGSTAASALLHGLLVGAMLLTVPRPPGGTVPEPQAVQMMFERPGSSGLTGPTIPKPQEGKTVEASAAKPAPSPAPPQPQEVPPPEALAAPEMPAPQPAPAPPSQQAMLQAPPAPEKPEEKPAEQHRPHPQKMMRLRMHEPASRAAPSTSPFSSPMDLSFASREPRQASRQRHGSASGIDLSLGPMVRNGALSVPYASTGIKGVSDDYGELLQEWIQRHLYYPEEAARKGEDGVAGVHVVIDRSGHVMGIETKTRSGYEMLDDATTGMFRNAKLPPVPPDMIGPTFNIELTVHYILLHRDG